MTDKQFVMAVEAYYGKYERPHVKASVLSYIGQFGNIQEIYDRLILEFSGQYKTTPDVAVIEKVRTGLLQEDPSGVYRHGKRIGHMDGNRFIPDLSLLSAEGIREYTRGYQIYGYPEGFYRLLENPSEDGAAQIEAIRESARTTLPTISRFEEVRDE